MNAILVVLPTPSTPSKVMNKPGWTLMEHLLERSWETTCNDWGQRGADIRSPLYCVRPAWRKIGVSHPPCQRSTGYFQREAAGQLQSQRHLASQSGWEASLG